jgi:Contact-dependent growth inhibition CdiA C-terminal domain
VEPSYIQKSQELYNLAEPEYERYYYNEDTGGFVLLHQAHNTNYSELFVALVFAKLGRRVKLLSEQAPSGVKTPDAEINGEIWEFKELSAEAVNIGNAFQRGVAIAKKRAPNLGYHINTIVDIKEVNKGLARALVWDTDKRLKRIELIFNDETVQTLTREELDYGQNFR